jgi:hypothetical protein
MPHDVFINHSTAGKLTAYAICSELESTGVRCWILPRDLHIGTGWDQSIANAVTSCRIMIFVLSDYANRSDRVERQLELAYNHGVVVIPFRTEADLTDSETQRSPDSAHWLDMVSPEMTQRLRALCSLVGALVLREKKDPLPVRTLAIGQEKASSLSIESLSSVPRSEGMQDKVLIPAKAMAGSPDGQPENDTPLSFETVDTHDSAVKRLPLKYPEKEKTSIWALIKALVLTLLPFAIICTVGLWHVNKGSELVSAKPEAAAAASISPPVAVKVQHLDRFAASHPGWGKLDANWAVADDKLQVTPLLNSSAVLINHKIGFTDAEIGVEVVMSKGEDLDQLGGLIFWAKDYNDCYALVISADGKFALGRKLIGRWINPIAKTGNPAIRTGIGQTNKLRVQTKGSLLTAYINDIKVASLGGEPPQGIGFIGLYGESGETTQNVWEFTNVTVTSVR